TDPTGNATGKVSDPAADIMAFLLSVPADWKPEPATAELNADEKAALNDLTTVWLSATFPRKSAERYANEGIPEKMAGGLKVDERVLLGGYKDENDKTQRQLDYVARRSLSRYGCFGCHDIPGYETAKPIGTPLASWGRKDPSQLAFENINEFLSVHGDFIPTKNGANHAGHESGALGAEAPHQAGADSARPGGFTNDAKAVDHAETETHEEYNPLDEKYDADTGYFLQ